jgi:hypothetical protein
VLAQFRKAWPVDEMLKQYLSYISNSINKDFATEVKNEDKPDRDKIEKYLKELEANRRGKAADSDESGSEIDMEIEEIKKELAEGHGDSDVEEDERISKATRTSKKGKGQMNVDDDEADEADQIPGHIAKQKTSRVTKKRLSKANNNDNDYENDNDDDDGDGDDNDDGDDEDDNKNDNKMPVSKTKRQGYLIEDEDDDEDDEASEASQPKVTMKRNYSNEASQLKTSKITKKHAPSNIDDNTPRPRTLKAAIKTSHSLVDNEPKASGATKKDTLTTKKQNSRAQKATTDKGRIGSYTKLCDFTLLFMILQVELRLNKGSLVRPRLVDQVKAHATIMTICEH